MQAFPAKSVWMEHRVSYGETDAMGYLYYAEYLHLFERGRSAFIRHLGMSYALVEEKGLMLPVREAGCRYRMPSRYDELIWIRVGLASHGKASMRFVYQLTDAERAVVRAEGFTEHACTNLAGKPVRMPEWLLTLIA